MTQYIKVGRNIGEPEYWSRGIVSPTTSNLFWNLGNIGIGQAVPSNKLVVDGNLSIGTTPYSSTSAPVDGAIIKGDVGIGTTNPSMKLDVWGNTNLNGDVNITGTLTASVINASFSKDDITGFVANQVVYGDLEQNSNFTYSPVTGLNVTGDVTATTLNATDVVISNNLTVNGTQTIINVETQITDQLIVQNAGTGPALEVLQTGTNDVAKFSTENQTVLAVTDNNCVGVLTTTPQYPLDVNGTIRLTHLVSDLPYVFIVKGNSTLLSTANGSTVQFNTIVYDPRGMFNTGNYTFVVPIKGVYQMSYNVTASIGTSTLYYIEVYVGTTQQSQYRSINNIITSPNSLSTCSASFIIQLNAGDSVKVTSNSIVTPINLNTTTSSLSGALLYALP